MNLLLYAPLGMFGFLSLSQMRLKAVAGGAPIAIGFALSCSMEMLQLFDAGRDTSALDVLSNTAGSAIGVACGMLFGSYLRKIQGGLQTIRYNQPGSLLLLICLAIRELAPFFPDYSPYRVRRKVIALLAVNELSVIVFLPVWSSGWRLRDWWKQLWRHRGHPAFILRYWRWSPLRC